MIHSISDAASVASMRMQTSNTPQPLSQEQRSAIDDTLSQYDPENLTQEEAASIVETFNEMGIQPGREMMEAMSASGFDAKAVGDLAGLQGPGQDGGQMMPKGPPPQLDISDEMLQELNGLLTDYYSNELSEDEKETTLSAIKEIFQQTMPEGGLIDEMA
jgi:uncharacterized protein (UPF0335 family)